MDDQAAANTQRVRANLAANLRRLRLQAGLTQEQLASAADVGGRHIQRIEAGEANVTLGSLARLATALGTSILQLVSERTE